LPYVLVPLVAKIAFFEVKILAAAAAALNCFGLGGETLTNQLLSRSYGTVDKLQADQPMEMQLAVNALSN